MSKLYISIVLSIVALCPISRTYTQNISNTSFADAIRASCPTCIDGSNNLTSAAQTLVELNINSKNVTSIDGIQYFTNLSKLYCEYNSLTAINSLPASLTQLFCEGNQISSLPSSLPSGMTILALKSNQLTSLPSLPSTLTRLNINFNQISTLPELPSTLESLSAFANQLSSLPNLPNSLKTLGVSANHLTYIPALPTHLDFFDCSLNNLSSLPSSLPSSVTYLDCSFNNISSIPDLPSSLNTFACSYNNSIGCLPVLPSSLTALNITNTDITCLKNKPSGLITSLPICNVGGCTYNPVITLPIELSDFEVFLVDKKANIKWITSSEINVSEFVIERSNDNLNFIPLSKEAPKGNASTTTEYSIIDEHPYNGITYYRLKTNDLDGTSSYSKTISIETNNTAQWQAFPNPFNDRIILKTNNADLENTHVQLWDITGREYISQTAANGYIDTQMLPKGVYILKIIQNGKTMQQKMVKN